MKYSREFASFLLSFSTGLRTDDANFRAMVFSDDVCFLVDLCGGAALLRRRGIDVDHP
jgi:hypothetical protein